MIEIELLNKKTEEINQFVDDGFEKYSQKNGVVCNYKSFIFVAKENDKIVGVLTGHSYYKEVHIGDFIVQEEYRGKQIGTKLIRAVEQYHQNKGFKNINLTTYGFQAPKFYEKMRIQS